MGLENKFPRIISLLEDIWGEPECRNYLNHLIVDSRDGERQGFEVEVASDILFLLEMHDLLFPQFQT